LFEQRIILAALSQIKPKQPIDPEHLFEIKTSGIKDLFTSKSVYDDLKNSVDKLYDRSVHIVDEETGTKIKHRWITRAEYVSGKGLVRIRFAPEIIPYISDLKKRFTKYVSQYTHMYRSKYSVRIYEMCLQWKKTGYFEISVDDLRERFELKYRYKTTSELRRAVINPAVSDIKEFSDINIRTGYKKSGKAISHFQFYFTYKDKDELALVHHKINEINNSTDAHTSKS